MSFDLKDYIEVADRIQAWYQQHPDGRIVTEIVEFTDSRATVKASAYRGTDDVPAGVGHSFLTIPGTTPYTKGSELENAETSAIGRALVAAGVPSKSVASAGEVRAKRNVGGSVPESVASGAPATTPEPKAGPSATSDEAGGLFVGDGNGAGAKALGEGADVPAPRAEYMSSKELSIWVKAMGGAEAAKAAAAARYGERIRGVNDVTRDMALELVNAKAGAA